MPDCTSFQPLGKDLTAALLWRRTLSVNRHRAGINELAASIADADSHRPLTLRQSIVNYLPKDIVSLGRDLICAVEIDSIVILERPFSVIDIKKIPSRCTLLLYGEKLAERFGRLWLVCHGALALTLCGAEEPAMIGQLGIIDIFTCFVTDSASEGVKVTVGQATMGHVGE